VQPNFRFNEQCTWNILFSYHKITNNSEYIHSIYTSFINRNQHRWRNHEGSTFITVAFAKPVWFLPGLAILINKILIYVVDDGPNHFPNFVYFPYDKGKFVEIDHVDTEHKIMFSPYYPKCITHKYPPMIFYTLSTGQRKYPRCLQHMGMGKLFNGNVQCSLVDHLIQSFQQIHNFTVKKLKGSQFLLPTIDSSLIISGDAGLSNIMCNFFQKLPEIFYCQKNTRVEDKIPVFTVISAFSFETWLMKVPSLIAFFIVIDFKRLQSFKFSKTKGVRVFRNPNIAFLASFVHFTKVCWVAI